MDLDLAASSKKGREKINLELSWWRVGQAETQPSGLATSNQAPEPPAEPAPETGEDSGSS